MATSPPVIAIVLAGGSGVRFGADVNKVLVSIGGQPVLAYSLATFDRSTRIDAVVIVVRAGEEALVTKIAAKIPVSKLAAVVPGGETRQGSEWAGIQAAANLGAPLARPGTRVLLHDAARPFLTVDLLDRILDDRPDTGTIPTNPLGVPVISPTGRPMPTADLRRVQTPQAFALDVLLDVYPRAESDGFAGVDTAETVQHYGAGAVRWVEGDPNNIKVTNPEDRARANELAARFDRANSRWRDDEDSVDH